VSTGGIVAMSVVALLTALFVPLRIAVAKQRREVETARARLASARVRRRAEHVSVEAIQRVGSSVGHVPRSATCALADDGLYCLSDDGRWGARVRFAAGAPQIGDVTLAAPPALVKAGGAVAGDLPGWIVPLLASLPRDGLLLQFDEGLSWFVAVPEAEQWLAALMPMLPPPSAAID
jgi:hypothetical protein